MTTTISCRVGRFIQGQIRRAIREGALKYGLTCSIEEDRGFPSSLLLITLSGDPEDIREFQKTIQKMAARHNAR